MQTFDDVQSLQAALSDLTEPGATIFVGIEGHSESGKSTLGRALARIPTWETISTDSYAAPDPSAATYLDHLDIDRLRAALATTSPRQSIVFIEGICLRDTIPYLRISPKAYVYCQRITQAGLWADDPANHDLDGLDGSGDDDPGWVDRQSIEYHRRIDPLSRADFVFRWVEGPLPQAR